MATGGLITPVTSAFMDIILKLIVKVNIKRVNKQPKVNMCISITARGHFQVIMTFTVNTFNFCLVLHHESHNIYRRARRGKSMVDHLRKPWNEK